MLSESPTVRIEPNGFPETESKAVLAVVPLEPPDSLVAKVQATSFERGTTSPSS
jgi:hypothetical protein